jgi:hypothetical protein
MEKKIATKMRKWEGGMKPYVPEREPIHRHKAYISGPAGVGNDSTTPNSTTGYTTHAGAFM